MFHSWNHSLDCDHMWRYLLFACWPIPSFFSGQLLGRAIPVVNYLTSHLFLILKIVLLLEALIFMVYKLKGQPSTSLIPFAFQQHCSRLQRILLTFCSWENLRFREMKHVFTVAQKWQLCVDQGQTGWVFFLLCCFPWVRIYWGRNSLPKISGVYIYHVPWITDRSLFFS